MTMSAILQDREANIWVGTNSGLDRFRITNLVPIVLSFKLHQPIWVAGDVLSDVVRVDGGRADKGHPLPSQALSAYRDPAGAIWWLCPDAIYRYDAGNYIRIGLPTSFPKSYQAAMIEAPKMAPTRSG